MFNVSIESYPKIKASVDQLLLELKEFIQQPLTFAKVTFACLYGIVLGVTIGLVFHQNYKEALFVFWMFSMVWWFNSYKDAT